MKNTILFLILIVLASCRSAQINLKSDQLDVQAIKTKPTWTGSMKSLHELLSTIEPFIFDTRQFVLDKNQSLLKFTIQGLADESKNLSHSPTLISRDPTIRYVAAQFADDLQMTEEAFAEGKRDFARYRLLKVTSYCVECHTRTQHGPEFKFVKAESFLNRMTAINQIEYLIATRQFDRAFDVVIKTVKSNRPGSSIGWDIEKVTQLGFQIAVQYRNSRSQAEQIISTIEENSDSPVYLIEKLSPWKLSLSFWKNHPADMENLEDVRTLVKNRNSEIDDMRAVSSLLQLLSQYLKGDELGEALYLTGHSYERINEISPLMLHENYYESCIRQAPHTKWSRRCFKRLESSIRFGYSGSGGMRIPMGIQVHLDILRKEAE